MNIFILDEDITKIPLYLVDDHVKSTILEGTQMLSTVCNMCGLDTKYKPTHKNHPCTLWTGTSLQNWVWLQELVSLTNEEYKYRFNHKWSHDSAIVARNLPIPDIPSYDRTKFVQNLPTRYKRSDPVNAYRAYYKGDKRHLFKWTNRDQPEWI